MKLTSRGFTLVELMIVIAIIGILAASLFPSLTNYLERSRDAARIANIKDASTAIWSYYSDNERFTTSIGGCLNTGALVPVYLPTVILDPTTNRNNGCGANGYYGYGVGTWAANSPQFLLTAVFEAEYGGNYSNVTGTGISTLIWTWSFTFPSRTALSVAWVVQKWNGSGYVIYK